MNLSRSDISLLQENIHLLTDEERIQLETSLSLLAKGCRTNKYIDAIRPNLHPKQIQFLALDCLEAMFGGAAGGGKVVYDDSVVLTPHGFRTGDSLTVGTLINNPDGTVARIIQLHPRKKYQVWRVRFHDGTFTDVAREHLWQAWRSGKGKKRANKRMFGDDAREVIETQELKEWCDSARAQQSRGNRPNWPCIPVCHPQAFNVSRKYPCTLDPYQLGAVLGDGCISGSRVYLSHGAADADYWRGVFETEEFSTDRESGMYLTGESSVKWLNQLRRMKLLGTRSETKFIPDEIKCGSLEVRRAVLQGLMDTDGTVDDRGQCYFTSVSERLADDVSFIVQSLGGTATKFQSVGSYRDDGGEIVECQMAYSLYIKLSDEASLFRMDRKKSRCLPGGSLMYRRVVSVEILQEERAGRCITVSHPNGLYLTNDFIVTHNSDALLLAALQYVDVPGYSAIIFRKTFTDLSGKGAIMDRAMEWLRRFPEVYWSAEKKTFTFPSGATLSFSYLQDPNDHLRYQGWEFQFVGFDELTQHLQLHYRYLFSRLRRLKGSTIPIRMRSATNPGGPGGEWVKADFITEEYLASSSSEQFGRIWNKVQECSECGGSGELSVENTVESCYCCDGTGTVEKTFVPSKIDDNPSLDRREYNKALSLLPPQERMRLQGGRWDVMETGELFKQAWFRYFQNHGGHYRLIAGDGRFRLSENGTRTRFITADTASKEKTSADPTVICTWEMTTGYDLILVNAIRERMEIPKIAPLILSEATRWQAQFVLIEDASSGIGVIQTLRGPAGRGLPVKSYNPHSRDKVARSTIAQIRMEAGQVFFPSEEAKWLTECQNELLAFPLGANDDFVDNLSMASWWVSTQDRQQGGAPPQQVRPGILPSVVGGVGGLPGLY